MIKKLEFVDSLRGLAILGVIMVHSGQCGSLNVPTLVEKIIQNGARGVQLFFLASAFTLFLSFRYRSVKENSPKTNFFIRRFFRIAPMYYLGIAYYLWQNGLGPRYWLGDATGISVGNIVSNVTFTHGIYPYWITSLVPGGWSITVEMTFYLCLPFIFAKVRNLNEAFGLFVLSLILNSAIWLFLEKNPLISDARLWREYLFLYFPSQLPVFILGIIMYFVIMEEKRNIVRLTVKMLMVIASLYVVHRIFGFGTLLPHHVVIGVGFMILGVCLSRFKPVLLVNPVIGYIGRISFSMYLVHFAVLHWLMQLNLIDPVRGTNKILGICNYGVRLIMVILIAVMISSVSYFLIEQPFQTLGKRLIAHFDKSNGAQRLV